MTKPRRDYRNPHDPLYCPYQVLVFNRDGELTGDYCLGNHHQCLIDESALTRRSCTRRQWMDTTAGKAPQTSPDGARTADATLPLGSDTP